MHQNYAAWSGFIFEFHDLGTKVSLILLAASNTLDGGFFTMAVLQCCILSLQFVWHLVSNKLFTGEIWTNGLMSSSAK